jgi:hypothetical protein
LGRHQAADNHDFNHRLAGLHGDISIDGMAAVAADLSLDLARVRNPSPILHATLALLLLLVAAVLAVYKWCSSLLYTAGAVVCVGTEELNDSVQGGLAAMRQDGGGQADYARTVTGCSVEG